MTITSSTLLVRDGAGNNASLRADASSADNSLAPHHVPEVAGAAIGPTNPMPARAPAVATVGTTTPANGIVLSAGPCTLLAVHANLQVTGWVMLFDSATEPADGTVQPRKAWFVSSVDATTLDRMFDPPLAMAAGAVLAVSTTLFGSGGQTGTFQKTSPASASAMLSGEIA